MAFVVAASPYLPINRGAVLINTSNVVIAAEDKLSPIVHAYPAEVATCDQRGTVGRCAKFAICSSLSLYNVVVSSDVVVGAAAFRSFLNFCSLAPKTIWTI